VIDQEGGPGANRDNPFAAPETTRPRQKSILMPGWTLIVFALVSVSIPAIAHRGGAEDWMTGLMYGVPAALTVFIIAPNNLRHDHDRKATIIALALTGIAIVATALSAAHVF
jgi:magnesium-transporting ATPase (P-type)